jgi:DNA-binding NtrC family response regulator
VSQTARLLSLQRTTLIEKIHKYDLRPANAASESPLSA